MQRGSACDVCLRVFRKQTGHQSVQKCKGDVALMQAVAEASRKLRGVEAPRRGSARKNPEERLKRVEALLLMLVKHLGLSAD